MGKYKHAKDNTAITYVCICFKCTLSSALMIAPALMSASAIETFLFCVTKCNGVNPFYFDLLIQ